MLPKISALVCRENHIIDFRIAHVLFEPETHRAMRSRGVPHSGHAVASGVPTFGIDTADACRHLMVVLLRTAPVILDTP